MRFSKRFALETPRFACRACEEQINQIVLGPERFLHTGQELVICSACGLGYLDPDFTDAALGLFYARYYRRMSLTNAARVHDESVFRQLFSRQFAMKRVEHLAAQLPPNAKLLEIGSGFGAFLGQLHRVRPDVQLFATEADATHQHLLLDGAPVTFLTDATLAEHGLYDMIVGFHVLEHLKYPVAMLKQLGEVLHADGHLFIEVPDIEAPWGSWLYVQPAHVSYFSAASLTRTMQRAGLSVTYAGANPAGEVLHGTLWAAAQKSSAVEQKTIEVSRASDDEIQRLFDHCQHYRWTGRDRVRQLVRNLVITCIGINGMGKLARWKYHRANQRFFTP